MTPGARHTDRPRRRSLTAALAEEQPLQIAGAVNAHCALLAEAAGFHALYLSGAGVANACFGLPDLNVITSTDVIEEARRLRAVSDLPLLVDGDAGGANPLAIDRFVGGLVAVGADGLHIEDQVIAKRCGHRPGKQLVSTAAMQARLEAAVRAKRGADFMVMARTDALAGEGLEAAIARSLAYLDAGADAIFAEACRDLDDVAAFARAVPAPVLVNVTEFGQSPMFTLAELASAGAAMALYPLTAYRAMARAAEAVFRAIRTEGSQSSMLGSMQTREELYASLGYHEAERVIDEFLAKDAEAPVGG